MNKTIITTCDPMLCEVLAKEHPNCLILVSEMSKLIEFWKCQDK